MSLSEQRRESLQKLRHAFQNIFEKYDKPFENTDIIDLMELRIVHDNGVLDSIEARPLGGPEDHEDFHKEKDEGNATTANLLHAMKKAQQQLLCARKSYLKSRVLDHLPSIKNTYEYQKELDVIQDIFVVHADFELISYVKEHLLIDQSDVEDIYLKYSHKDSSPVCIPTPLCEPDIPDSLAIELLSYHSSTNNITHMTCPLTSDCFQCNIASI